MNPSGLDAKTCLSDRAIKFIKNVGFSEFETNLGAYLVIADTGIYGHTREAIQKVESIGRRALPHLHQLGKLTNEVEAALKIKDLEAIGMAMSEAHLSLKSLGVSCSEADKLVSIAQANGALGAKMSGGGLGGCIIALVANKEKASWLSQLLREKGAVHTWIESL